MTETLVRELLRREEVEERFGVSRSWIYCEMRAGRFPEPVRIGKRAVRWRVLDLDEWAASRRWRRVRTGTDERTGAKFVCEAVVFPEHHYTIPGWGHRADRIEDVGTIDAPALMRPSGTAVIS